MRERNRSGSGGRRRSGADGEADLFAKQLSESVQHAFVESDATLSNAVPITPNQPVPVADRALPPEREPEEVLVTLPTAPVEQEEAPNTDPSVEPLPARMLNEFVYCPRLFYYEHVEGVFVDNADTVRGAAGHARVDKGSGAMPAADGEKTEPATAEDGEGSGRQKQSRRRFIRVR